MPNIQEYKKKKIKGCVVWGLVFKGKDVDKNPIHFWNGVCVYPSRKMALEEIKHWGGKKSVMVKRFIIKQF
jgi:hypothetical protein